MNNPLQKKLNQQLQSNLKKIKILAKECDNSRLAALGLRVRLVLAIKNEPL